MPVPESVHIFAMEPEPFRAVTLGLKQAIVLPLGLGVLVGDQVVMREWRCDRDSFTGAWLCRRVTHEERGAVQPAGVKLDAGTGLHPRYAVYSLNNAAENEWARAYLVHRLSSAWGEGLSQDQFWQAEDARERARRDLLRKVG